MSALIDATYEDGFFKPLLPVKLPEHLHVILSVSVADDDIPVMLLSRLAEQSASYKFLEDPREDIYSSNDGEPC